MFVAVGDDLHVVSGFGEELVGFGPSFFGTGFGSTGAMGDNQRKGDRHVFYFLDKLKMPVPFFNARIKAEPDLRWKVWLRVRALGERKVNVARELGYRDGGTVLQIMKRLEEKATRDSSWAQKLEIYQKELSSVESLPRSPIILF